MLPNFPVMLDEVHTQVGAADLLNNRQITLVAADRAGNIVAYTREGVEVGIACRHWRERASGPTRSRPQPSRPHRMGAARCGVASLADLGAARGRIPDRCLRHWRRRRRRRPGHCRDDVGGLRGGTARRHGRAAGGLPRPPAGVGPRPTHAAGYAVRPRVCAPRAWAQGSSCLAHKPRVFRDVAPPPVPPCACAQRRVASAPLTIIAPTVDGALYFVRPGAACIDRIDIGGRVYGRVLADQVTGRNRMDLVMATAEGEVICLATQVPYDPLKARYEWQPSRDAGRADCAIKPRQLNHSSCSALGRVPMPFLPARPWRPRRCRTARATWASMWRSPRGACCTSPGARTGAVGARDAGGYATPHGADSPCLGRCGAARRVEQICRALSHRRRPAGGEGARVLPRLSSSGSLSRRAPRDVEHPAAAHSRAAAAACVPVRCRRCADYRGRDGHRVQLHVPKARRVRRVGAGARGASGRHRPHRAHERTRRSLHRLVHAGL